MNRLGDFSITIFNRDYCLSLLPIAMQKLLIRASQELADTLEEKLRYRYDIETEILDKESICEIMANIRREWITICRFTSRENLKDILTMFRVNYEIKKRD
jgi:hypothetical protein